MIRASVLAAALATAPTLVLAQEAAAPAAEAPGAPAPGEAEFQAAAMAFGARIQAMGEEMQAAVTAAGGDAAKQDADLDAIEARYQPDIDAFIAALEGFVQQQAASSPESERAEMLAELAEAGPQIRAVPGQVRAQIEAAATAPAAPAAPTPPAS